MASGMITILTVLTIRSSAQATNPITISRQHQAAAIRSPCGTWASSRLAVVLCACTGGSAPTTSAVGGATGPGASGEATRADSGTSIKSLRSVLTGSRRDS
ncbi:hypothetical protein GCM10027614_54760 [Micromonospora vulcania]